MRSEQHFDHVSFLSRLRILCRIPPNGFSRITTESAGKTSVNPRLLIA
ncbi:MAG: hypothetical protein LBU17_09400 [Treponema sp.]|nr:hypothetical protein [Treponema sp.]